MAVADTDFLKLCGVTPTPDNNWKDSPKFKDIKGITLSDCLNGTGQIEKITKGYFTPAKPVGNVFKFGKYKGRSYQEVEEENPGYISWCRENIKNFNY